MNKKFTAFIIYSENSERITGQLRHSGFVEDIWLITKNEQKEVDGCYALRVKDYSSTETIRAIALNSHGEFILLQLEDVRINIEQNLFEKVLNAFGKPGSGIIYSDFSELKNNDLFHHSLIDYQFGSIRDDFDFGSIISIRTESFKKAAESIDKNYKYAGLYDLRLRISQKESVVRIPESLYSVEKPLVSEKKEKQFNYVDPINREAQVEMESAVTSHLKAVGCYLRSADKEVVFNDGNFPVEASVIIPVKNRVRTIKHAVDSALGQRTDFNFNVIVVDNYSSDGTTEILKAAALRDKRLVHHIPVKRDLGIGGCWNEAINHKLCGRFSCQLDSDDLYKDENTLQKITDAFKREKAAMVIGSYILTDFNLNTIPPGIIDHREWTEENGRNNALRINGLGAPRAFFTPVIRRIAFPDVSYGEDYAAGLAISRDYKIARIYEPIYYCRRWEDNSDANLDFERRNKNNFYKDQLRTLEMLERQKKNKTGGI